MEMSLNTKMEVALEIISAKIAYLSNSGYTTENEEMKKLLKEKDQVYFGDEETIDKIINVYGLEIKNKYKNAEKHDDYER